MSDTKQCKRCGETKPITTFDLGNRCVGGRRPNCRACTGRGSKKTPAVPKPLPVPVTIDKIVVEHRDKRTILDLRARERVLLADNERLQAELETILDIKAKAPEIIVYKQAAKDRADAVAAAVLSDWHVEEPVDAAAVHGLNEYNLDIARDRAARCFQNVLYLTDMMAKDSKITTIYLSLLGDFITGWIHEELIANTLLAPADAARFCAGLLMSGIDFLLRESSYRIEADCIPGNHGRMTKTMHFGDPTGTSLETFMYHMVAARYHGNPRVSLNVSEHAMVYRKFFEKFVVRNLHGYEMKYQGGVGGITIPVNKSIAQWDKAVRADLTLFGHFHQLIDGGRFIGNGSLIGHNTFAQAIKAEFEEPRQSFFLVHARHGGQKATTAPIWVTP